MELTTTAPTNIMKEQNILVQDYAQTSAVLSHHLSTEGDLWPTLYQIASKKQKGWLELNLDIGELAIAYEEYWQGLPQDEQDKVEWFEGILEIGAIIAEHYENETPWHDTAREACERVKNRR